MPASLEEPEGWRCHCKTPAELYLARKMSRETALLELCSRPVTKQPLVPSEATPRAESSKPPPCRVTQSRTPDRSYLATNTSVPPALVTLLGPKLVVPLKAPAK